ncbi:response regulator [Rhizobium grahamii]|uniref:Response regulator receiver n=1 Tax=Rhizobium grahamii CCGE 502 TaxID=990285 RepID=S3IL92_9HYPH|nr:response regulator [Rhizobium grahamii]EPE99558.1 response regulator receiver [Rhizobium grahamii CCGE 502]
MVGKPELDQPLSGARILIAEDEILIALDMEAAFLDAGAYVVGPCATVAAAVDAVSTEELSLAILDIRLGQETTERIGDLLTERGVPFLFYSGQTLPDEMKRKCNGVLVVSKPATQQELIGAAARTLAV